jgi:predicted protein tyrosine phosphatase
MLRSLPRRSGCLTLHALRGLLAGALVAVVLHFALVLGGPNFRTVVPGRVYRSGQLSPSQLDDHVRRHGIRTVVNLRGCCVGAKWYRHQADATARLDVAQEDLSFSATRMPSSTAVRELIEILDRSEPPLLLHCHQGADRTGLASVVVLLLHTDATLDESLHQLGPACGHLPLGRTANVDRFFDLYRDWLDEMGHTHSPDVFRLWASEHYCPDGARADFSLVEPAASVIRVRVAEPKKVTVRCHNRSRTAWRFEPGVTAGVHGHWRVLDRDERVVAVGRSGLRRATVEPGGGIDLEIALPPLGPGEYTLFVDLADEQHATFMQLGNEMLAVRLEVCRGADS